MFLYSSKHALSLSTDIISPMTTSDQINYNNYHAELGLFKFLISVYFSQNYENRRKFLGNTYPSAPPPSPSGFTKPITFCKRLVITGDGVLVIVAVERAPLTKWKSRIAIVSGVIGWPESESEESERFHLLPLPLMTPKLMIQWKLNCRSRRKRWKINQLQCEYSGHPIAFNPTIQFSLDRMRPHFVWFHRFDFS